MYQLIKLLSLRELLQLQLPAFSVALIIAEFFYKFHSFTLECVAFVLTWAVVDFALTALRGEKSE
jgi:hypothetical protein